MKACGNNLYYYFLQQCSTDPQKIALEFQNRKINFGDLKEIVDACASWLLQKSGCTPETLVGQRVVIQLPKAPLTYGLWLACLRQGAVYTFVDPKNPETRTESIINRLKPKLVISVGKKDNAYGVSICLESLEGIDNLDVADRMPPEPADLNDSDPAYVMFTSGSTGEPKGAVIPGRGVVNLMAWARQCVIPLATDSQVSGRNVVFSNINPLHFDNSVFDLFCGLMNGHTLAPIETGEMGNPAQWVKRLQQTKTQVIFGVPTLFQTMSQLRLLSPDLLPDAKLFVFGGEGFPVKSLRNFHDNFRDKAVLLNVYGPTETSCICSSIEIDDASLSVPDIKLPSIGRMHRGYKYCILDDDGEEVRNGRVGELWIGGENVGLGYFDDQKMSANAFKQNPLQHAYRDIWYKTGDLVSEDEDGLLWFAGRIDNQVKVRGYRIELEEIDSAVERFNDIDRANTVLAPVKGNETLIVVFNAEGTIDINELRSHCRAQLPSYMVPGKFVQMAKLPINSNGKVDRKAIRSAVAE